MLVFISVAELAFSVVSGRETNGTVTYLKLESKLVKKG